MSDLGGAGHQSWVVTSYLLASTITTAIVGKLGDRRLGAVRTLVLDDDAGGLAGTAGDRRRGRWAFWINVPVAALVMAVAAVAIPSLGRTGRVVIDYPGILLVGLGATGLTLATSWGGALTFLPTFMQFVDGVSATESGLRTLPMVVGLLTTSITSGVLVGRTGRYKIFPVVGTAVMAVGCVLLSGMSAATPVWRQSLDLFVLGSGIGLCMQVLVLTVQNTVDFDDLGVATSGVTFFRTIGSSFGAAIFGSLFVNFLDARIGPALAAGGAPPAAAQSPKVLHSLAPQMAAPVVDAYADALGRVFLCAAPVALVGFVLALLLKEVPLCEIDTAPVDLGEGFAMPSTETSEEILEVAVSRMMRDSPDLRLRSLVGRPGCHLDISGLWGLLQIYRNKQVFGSARLTDIGARLRVPCEVLEPTFAQLIRDGYAMRGGDDLWLTQAGMREVDEVSAAIVSGIVHKLERSPSFAGRPDRLAVEAALERIAHRMLVQREWDRVG